MAILCFSGDPFQSTSDFDLELADDGGRSVTLCFCVVVLAEGRFIVTELFKC